MRSILLFALQGLATLTAGLQSGFEPLAPEPCDWQRCRRWPDHEPEGRAERSAPGPRELAPELDLAHELRSARLTFDFEDRDFDAACAVLAKHLHMPVRASAAARSAVAQDAWSANLAYGPDGESAKRVLDEMTRFAPDYPPEDRQAFWVTEAHAIRFVTASEYEQRVQGITDGEQERLAEFRSRVVVQWDPVRLHELELGREQRPGYPFLVLSGRLSIQDKETKERVPLTWQLGARVLIEREPGTHPDWNGGYDANTLAVDTLVNDDGSFAVHVEPWELRRTPGETRGFQVALCLPDMEPGGIWRDVTRPLPHGRSDLSIPGPIRLSESLQLINASPIPVAELFDPVPLIRAVNHLHGLGKDKALESLRQYAELAPSSRQDLTPVAASLDFADGARIFFIVHLLFEPIEDAWHRPRIFSRLMAAMPLDGNEYADPSEFPGHAYPFVVIDDFPFLMPAWLGGRTGSDSNPLGHVTWAERNGRLRERPLRPPDDPFAALNELLSLPDLPADNDPRLQVWRAVAEAIGIPAEVREPIRRGALQATDPAWQRVVAAASRLSLRWDEAGQRYVSGL